MHILDHDDLDKELASVDVTTQPSLPFLTRLKMINMTKPFIYAKGAQHAHDRNAKFTLLSSSDIYLMTMQSSYLH